MYTENMTSLSIAHFMTKERDHIYTHSKRHIRHFSEVYCAQQDLMTVHNLMSIQNIVGVL